MRTIPLIEEVIDSRMCNVLKCAKTFSIENNAHWYMINDEQNNINISISIDANNKELIHCRLRPITIDDEDS